MEFRKIVTIILDARQQKRQRCEEQSFGLCGRGWSWDDLGEWHWNMYIIICETNRQSRFDAWDRVLRAGVLGWPWRMRWGGRWERGSGWGTHVHPWMILWQNSLQYCKIIILQLNKFVFFLKKHRIQVWLKGPSWDAFSKEPAREGKGWVRWGERSQNWVQEGSHEELLCRADRRWGKQR